MVFYNGIALTGYMYVWLSITAARHTVLSATVCCLLSVCARISAYLCCKRYDFWDMQRIPREENPERGALDDKTYAGCSMYEFYLSGQCGAELKGFGQLTLDEIVPLLIAGGVPRLAEACDPALSSSKYPFAREVGYVFSNHLQENHTVNLGSFARETQCNDTRIFSLLGGRPDGIPIHTMQQGVNACKPCMTE